MHSLKMHSANSCASCGDVSCDQKKCDVSSAPRAILAVTHNSISNAVKTFHRPSCSMLFLIFLGKFKKKDGTKNMEVVEWIGARRRKKELAIS